MPIRKPLAVSADRWVEEAAGLDGLILASYLSDADVQGWWKFDEHVDGASFVDSSGNGFDLTNSTVGEAIDGVFGSCAYFDGGTDNAKCSIDSRLAITTNITVEGVAMRLDAGEGCIVGHWNNGGGPSGPGPWVGWTLSVTNTQVVCVMRTTDNATYYGILAGFDRDDMPIGDFCMLRMTYDGANIRLYLMNLALGETQYTLKVTQPCTGDIIYSLGDYDTLGFGALNFDANPSGQSHFRGITDQWAISSVVRESSSGFEDLYPEVTEVVNLGNKFRSFDNIYCKSLYASDRVVGDVLNNTPDNVCYVSSTFTEDEDRRRYTTIADALTYVATQSPSVASQWEIIVYPGVYAESVTMLSWVHLTMRTGQITGVVTLADNSRVRVDRVVSTTSAMVLPAGATETATVEANYLEVGSGTALSNLSSTTGVLMGWVKQIVITGGGLGVGDFTANGHIHAIVGDIYLEGNSATGVISAAGGKAITGRIDHILVSGAPTNPRGLVVLSGGQLDLVVSELLIPTGVAYIVYAGGELNLFVNEISGAETDSGGTIDVTKASHGTNVSNPHAVAFLQLGDSPASYAGQASKLPSVNAAEDALEFVEADAAVVELASRYIYVDADTGSDSNDGTSWAEAFLTLQYAIDSIKPIISNGVIIHVVCRGTFEDDGSDEQSMAQVQKTCQGAGRISIDADGYEYRRPITGAGVNYVEITASRGDDFYNDCWVWISPDNGSRLQLRKITDTIQTGGTLKLVVSPNWTTTPSVGHLAMVAGRANCKQRAASPPWRAFEVIGGDTYCIIYGFMFEDWNQGEAVPFYARQGCAGQVRACAWTDCDTANGMCAFWDKGSQGYALECIVDGSVANTGIAFSVQNQSYCFMNRVQAISKQYAIVCSESSRAVPLRFASSGGTRTGRAYDNSVIDLSTTYGADGSSDGFVADVFGVISETGSIAHTVRRELDLTSTTFKPLRTSASAEPTPEVGELRVWRDPDDNKTYLIYNDTDEGVRKVEMT